MLLECVVGVVGLGCVCVMTVVYLISSESQIAVTVKSTKSQVIPCLLNTTKLPENSRLLFFFLPSVLLDNRLARNSLSSFPFFDSFIHLFTQPSIHSLFPDFHSIHPAFFLHSGRARLFFLLHLLSVGHAFITVITTKCPLLLTMPRQSQKQLRSQPHPKSRVSLKHKHCNFSFSHFPRPATNILRRYHSPIIYLTTVSFPFSNSFRLRTCHYH